MKWVGRFWVVFSFRYAHESLGNREVWSLVRYVSLMADYRERELIK